MSGTPVLELLAKFVVDSKEVDNSINDAKSKYSGFASFLGGVGKVGAAAFTAIGTATVAIGKQALDAYSNYEQLKGGIDKLFGEESAQIVSEYAEKAFLTSGKSVNDYYNSVSQITASLKRSIGDDMGEVARVADIAMQVISDNVNTFGSDAEFVENAIMGLSRQNYTMIDNLKLGYAGNAEGMRQLINESGVLGYTLKSTSDLANVGFDKMILAIQKIQEQQNIAGTTAKEALYTIEGAGKATKAAWQNVLTAIGTGEEIGEALSGLSTALFGDGTEKSGLLSQLIERIPTIMEGIGQFVVQSAPLIAAKIPEVLEAILPSVATTVTNLTAMLVKFIGENMPSIVKAGVDMLNWLADGIKNNFPQIVQTAVEMLAQFLGEIIYELPDIVAAGINIVMGLIEGIINSIPSVLDALGVLIDKGWQAITNFDWISLGKNIIRGIASGISSLGYIIGDTLLSMARSAWRSVKNFFGISSPSKLMRDTIGKFIPLGMAEGIEDEADQVYDAMDELGNNSMDSFDTVFDDITKTKVGGLGGAVNYGGLTFNIYGAEGQDVHEIAEAVKEIIINEEERSRLVYA